MRKILKIFSLVLCGAMMMSFTSCNKDENNNSSTNTAGVDAKNTVSIANSGINQLDPPSEGDTIAVIKVKGYGEIKIRLFKETTPKAFENFTKHAKDGYYDGVIFHRVVKDFVIQGGDPEGTGAGGESIWHEGFGIEIDSNLHHYRGALGMARGSNPNSNGSQFYIVQKDSVEDYELKQAEMAISDEVKARYKEVGGTPYLDGGYTVFGQVYEGMDVVDKIASVDVNDEKPLKDVVIETIEISEYKK